MTGGQLGRTMLLKPDMTSDITQIWKRQISQYKNWRGLSKKRGYLKKGLIMILEDMYIIKLAASEIILEKSSHRSKTQRRYWVQRVCCNMMFSVSAIDPPIQVSI